MNDLYATLFKSLAKQNGCDLDLLSTDLDKKMHAMGLYKTLNLSIDNRTIIEQNQESHNRAVESYELALKNERVSTKILAEFVLLVLTGRMCTGKIKSFARACGIGVVFNDGKPTLSIKPH